MERILIPRGLVDWVARKRFAAAALVVLLASSMFCGCGGKEEPASREVVRPVKVATVQGGSHGVSLTFPGKTRANRRVDLSFKVPGPLVELPVEEGQEIKKGELVARILPRDFKINLDQAKARAIEAERQYDRYKELYVRRQVSRAEFDRYKAARDVAAARLEDAQNALKDTYLKAPFDGIVARRYVENFEEVQAKQPIVFFQDISRIEVIVDAPETVIATLKHDKKIEAKATFAAAPGKQFPLELKEFSTEADPQTQTYQVVLVMDQPRGINVLPGMTATVTGRQATIGDAATRIVIPAIAVTQDAEKKPYVWVLNEKDMKVKKNEVRVGEMTGSDGIVILDGLSGGEKVVTSGVTQLKEGMKVSIWQE